MEPTGALIIWIQYTGYNTFWLRKTKVEPNLYFFAKKYEIMFKQMPVHNVDLSVIVQNMSVQNH